MDKNKFYVSKEQETYLRKYLPDIDKLLNGDIDNLLVEINQVVVDLFVDDEPTEEAYEVEKVMDAIYYQNS